MMSPFRPARAALRQALRAIVLHVLADHFELLLDGEEGVGDGRVEVRAFSLPDDAAGRFVGEGLLVRPVGAERVVDVHQRHDARAQVPDPEITGYGMLAKAYLDREGLWQQGLASRRILVLSSGPQTVTAVESGTVQSALMSLTLVRKLSGGFSLVPGASIDQVVGVAPGAGPEARRFAEFLCSENARALLEQGGFVVPQAPEERP